MTIYKVRHYDLHEKYATVVTDETADLNKLDFNSKVLSLMQLWLKSSSNFIECPFRGSKIYESNCNYICVTIFPGIEDPESITKKGCPCKEYRPVDVVEVIEKVIKIHKAKSFLLRIRLFFNSIFKRSYNSWF